MTFNAESQRPGGRQKEIREMAKLKGLKDKSQKLRAKG